MTSDQSPLGARTIDVDEMRNPVIAMHDLINVDTAYTVYYDETNNIRRLHVTPEGLNVGDPKCFVLGGIAYDGPMRDLGFDRLSSALRLQPSAKELKFSHLAKGDFLDVLGASKVATLLEWLNAEGLFIHYEALDPLYWSTVDIVDSILAEDDENPILMMMGPALKNDLHGVLRADLTCMIDLFQRYTYPNVGRDRRKAFISELLDALEAHRDEMEHFSFQMLKGLLQIGLRLDRLPFLEEERPNVLIDEFSTFYLHRLCLLKNAQHVLDTEPVIIDRLEAMPLTLAGAPFRNFRFVARSEDEPGVQISDAIVDLVGKFYSWIIAAEMGDVVQARRSLSPRQEAGRKNLRRLVDRSIGQTPAFAHRVMSLADQYKADRFLEG
ncbi:hypothetical protein [Brevundimonas sp. A19_0]|uniref:hypothetical protein n=1 Tax=Brevundimonas sp. A19_0 TaxID=2821087 RepID=UPI001ADB3DCB|nr:hypothetical protein [Brevundimonas sp. A19_0]MBO9501632.1 hypothetical protein [Brevundimonas sp. A19_0]